MAPQEKWDALEEDEAECLSLSDFPVLVDKPYDIDEPKSSVDEDFDNFEFLTSAAAGGLLCSSSKEPDMCAADEVFFQGRILPLRPSAAISLDGASFAVGSRSGSRSESWDRYSSRSSSSGSNSCCSVSRSHSSSSAHSSSSSFEQQQRCRPPPLSNNFYTHPSPTPQVLSGRKTSSGGGGGGGRRKSTNPAPLPPAGWSIFRLGVAKAPEIELHASRSRRGGSVSGRMSSAATKRAKEEAVRGGSANCYPPTESGGGTAKAQRKAVVSGGRFSCKCSADAVEPIAMTKTTISRR